MHIIKRRGHKEPYDERKIYASVYSACLSAHLAKEAAEKVADRISFGITAWIGGSEMVSSEDIFQETIKILKKENKDIAFMFETHRDVA